MTKPIIDPEFRALIPPLSGDERAQLEANIKAEGCRDALVVWHGILLDGHNRFEICERLGVEYKTKDVELKGRAEAADWIDRNQLGRRNLTPDQMSLLRGRRYNRAKRAANDGGRGTPKSTVDQNEPRSTAYSLAKEHGVSPATIKRDGKIAEFLEQHPKEAASVISGEKKLTEVRREVKKKDFKEQPPMPDENYRVILADPPWKYGDQLTENYGGTKFHYPSMTIAELCALPVKDMAEENAVLFLWVTSPLLAECWPIIRAWGFEYKACFVWDKIKHNWGHYNSVRHEFLLICTRGSCLPDEAKLFDSVQSIERSDKHSEKPNEFREIIGTLYPNGRRIELFAREKTPGWDSWGNE